jgi:hypothetical protein
MSWLNEACKQWNVMFEWFSLSINIHLWQQKIWNRLYYTKKGCRLKSKSCELENDNIVESEI